MATGPDRMLDKFRGKGLLLPTLAASAAFVLLVGLGIWQWQRKAWKEELIATIDARIAAAPVAPDQWAALNCRPLQEVGLAASCDFKMVRLAGRFDHGGERHVFANVPRSGSGPGGPGYWVLTPFELENAPGSRIYVNRGFVPEPRKDPASRSEGQIADRIEIVGQVRTAEPRGIFINDNSPRANVWFLRNPRELLGLGEIEAGPPGWQAAGPDPLEFYVEQIAPPPPGGLPAPRPSRIELPNRHLEYALTWWGLSLTLVGVYVAFVLGRIRGWRPDV